jgi:hypothetical protein
MSQNTQSYKNNPNLPTARAEHDYTPEMMRDLIKAKNDIHFFSKFFTIINVDEGRKPITLHKFQDRVLRKMVKNRFFILLASRQIGKTTLFTIYALWVACFQKDQRILIVANKEDTAIEILGRVRLAYEELPNWLKPGVVAYGKTSVELSNGSQINISTTTGTAARGQAVGTLIIDEMAFVEPHIMKPFWSSVYPVISSSKKSKIFIASTANGTDNLFYKLFTGAENNTNGWACDKVLWNEVPGRDDAWVKLTKASMDSEEAFDQEFGCCAGNTLVRLSNKNEQYTQTIEELYERLQCESK